MRKSRVIALAIASLVSSASFVQAQSTAPAAKAARQEMRGIRGGHAGGALKGITLSDAEKAKLKAIHGKYATESKSLRESLKPAMQEARAARQKGDTVAAKAVRERNKGGREQLKALHDRQQAEVRGALSPEHQKQFDANVATAAQRRADFAKDGGRKGHKGQHKGHRAGING
jgi:periplasmic protein CpxP/Spy